MPEPMVVPVHTAVPGRVRFQVAGLYQAPSSCRARLENGLQALAGVHRGAASSLTGNLLVQFDGRHESLDALSILVEHEARAAGLTNGHAPLHAISQPSPRTNNALRALALEDPGTKDPRSASVPCAPVSTEPLPWHALDLETVVQHLHTSVHTGLDTPSVTTRLAQYGPNTLAAP